MLRELAALPLAEDIPIAHNSCRRGPRSVGWRDDHPAALEWLEAQARPPQAVEECSEALRAVQLMLHQHSADGPHAAGSGCIFPHGP